MSGSMSCGRPSASRANSSAGAVPGGRGRFAICRTAHRNLPAVARTAALRIRRERALWRTRHPRTGAASPRLAIYSQFSALPMHFPRPAPFHRTVRFAFAGAALVLAIGSRCAAGELESAFAIHDGDRVVFYGDSITQDGGYACFVEEYCRTRFPRLDVRFFNAGVGGDTVQGGSAGDIGLRLDRDVIRHKPTIVAIMLGMNDGRYRKLEPATLASFTDGYRMIVAKLRQALPRARIYLIRSSPFDDVARPPNFEPGYMNVLRRNGEAVEAIAREQQATVVDFGGAVASGLELAVRNDPERAHHLLPDRVHPSPAGHVLMGATLLRALGATAFGEPRGNRCQGWKGGPGGKRRLSDLKLSAGLVTWNELDQSSLPLNFQDAQRGTRADCWGGSQSHWIRRRWSSAAFPGGATRSGRRQDHWHYPESDLGRGVNLALIDTPMRWKAYQVLWASEEGPQCPAPRTQFEEWRGGRSGALAAADFLLAKDESDQASRSKGADPAWSDTTGCRSFPRAESIRQPHGSWLGRPTVCCLCLSSSTPPSRRAS